MTSLAAPLPAADDAPARDGAISAGPMISALSCGKPAFLVVLLHEEGACGQDVINLALNWAPELPKADFLAAEAPFVTEGGGRRWFPDDPMTPEAISAGLAAVGPKLEAFLAEMLAARRLPDHHLALVGFSQGAMLALHAGLRRPNAPAVVISFGGALPEDDPAAEAVTARPPVVFIHGEADAVVPAAQMIATRDRLKALGIAAKSMRRPELGHGVDDVGIIAAGDVLTQSLKKKPPAAAAQESHDQDSHDQDSDDHDDHDHDDHDHDHDH
ncbi:dienelactone hydrolase family protein [Xanthobacter sp. KR7-65]